MRGLQYVILYRAHSMSHDLGSLLKLEEGALSHLVQLRYLSFQLGYH